MQLSSKYVFISFPYSSNSIHNGKFLQVWFQFNTDISVLEEHILYGFSSKECANVLISFSSDSQKYK